MSKRFDLEALIGQRIRTDLKEKRRRPNERRSTFALRNHDRGSLGGWDHGQIGSFGGVEYSNMVIDSCSESFLEKSARCNMTMKSKVESESETFRWIFMNL